MGVAVEDDAGDSDEGSSMGGNGRAMSGRGLKEDGTEGGVEDALWDGGHSARGGRLGIFSLKTSLSLSLSFGARLRLSLLRKAFMAWIWGASVGYNWAPVSPQDWRVKWEEGRRD